MPEKYSGKFIAYAESMTTAPAQQAYACRHCSLESPKIEG